METKFSFLHLFSVVALLLSTGCLVRETVTVGGEVREDDLKFKRPIRDAIKNTENPPDDF
jgi:hypothetical protein